MAAQRPSPRIVGRSGRLFIAFLVSVLVACVVLLVLMLTVWQPKPGSLGFEAAKALLEVITVTVTGLAVALLADAYQRAAAAADRKAERLRERREYDRGVMTTVLDEATAAYNGIKSVRRLLRAEARDEGPEGLRIVTPAYDRQMRALNTRQLQLEALSDRIEATVGVFADKAAVKLPVDVLEKQLGQLISEFEKVRPTFSGEPKECLPGRLPSMNAFIGDKAKFSVYSEPFHALQERLMQDIRTTYEDVPEPAAD